MQRPIVAAGGRSREMATEETVKDGIERRSQRKKGEREGIEMERAINFFSDEYGEPLPNNDLTRHGVRVHVSVY